MIKHNEKVNDDTVGSIKMSRILSKRTNRRNVSPTLFVGKMNSVFYFLWNRIVPYKIRNKARLPCKMLDL
jgi:hypothetical protein